MDIKFFYQTNQRSYKHEAIITSFANLLSQLIDLPDYLEVCLYPLAENMYGGIDINRVNRIGLNIKLPYMDIPKVLTHELIHVNQKHIGLLRTDTNGMCYWRGIPYTNKDPDDMTYEEYSNLPWELDAQQRQTKLLSEAIRGYKG